MLFVEMLPTEVRGKGGEKYFLRIKARAGKKKWCVRYIRKVHTGQDPEVPGWKYRTELQAWGRTLEIASEAMVRRLKVELPGRVRQAF